MITDIPRRSFPGDEKSIGAAFIKELLKALRILFIMEDDAGRIAEDPFPESRKRVGCGTDVETVKCQTGAEPDELFLRMEFIIGVDLVDEIESVDAASYAENSSELRGCFFLAPPDIGG